jgi:hypothetical protein
MSQHHQAYQAYPAEVPMLQPPHQVLKPPYAGAQSGCYPIDMPETLLHCHAMLPAEPFPTALQSHEIAAPALAPVSKQEASSSDSQHADSGCARIQLPSATQPDTPSQPPHVKGKVKQTHRTAQKRYRERQKVLPGTPMPLATSAACCSCMCCVSLQLIRPRSG